MRSVPLIIIAVANVVQFVCLLAGSAGIAELMIFHPVCIALPHFFFFILFFFWGIGPWLVVVVLSSQITFVFLSRLLYIIGGK